MPEEPIADAPPVLPVEESSPDWRTTLPEEMREPLGRFKSVEELGKGYINAEKLIGSKRALPPEDDMEGWNEVYKDLGRPDTPDQYELTKPANLPKDSIYMDELEKEFRGEVHRLGLSGKAAKGIYDWYMTKQIAEVEGLKALGERDRKEGEVLMRGKYGKDYEPMMEKADAVLRTFGNPDALPLLREYATDPNLKALLVEVGKSLSEDTFVRGAAVTPDIDNEIMKTESEMKKMVAEGKDNTPEYEAMFNTWNILNERKYPGVAGRETTRSYTLPIK